MPTSGVAFRSIYVYVDWCDFGGRNSGVMCDAGVCQAPLAAAKPSVAGGEKVSLSQAFVRLFTGKLMLFAGGIHPILGGN